MSSINCLMRVCFPIIFILGLAFTVLIANLKPDFLKNQFNNFIDGVQIKKTESEKETYRRSIEPSAFE